MCKSEENPRVQVAISKALIQEKSKREHSSSLLLPSEVNGNNSANEVNYNKVKDGAGRENQQRLALG